MPNYAAEKAADIRTLNKPSLGIGLGVIRDWDERRIIDLMKQADAWVNPAVNFSDPMPPPYVDGDGDIVSFAPGQTEAVRVFLRDKDDGVHDYVNGTYTLTWDGGGTTQVQVIVASPANTDLTSPATITVDLATATGNFQVRLRNLDETDPPRNMRLIKTTDQADYDAGHVFLPAPALLFDHYDTWRFMDWTRTNNSDVSAWSERALPSHVSWATDKGVPLEEMVAFCNRYMINPWFNFPHKATDDYVTQFVTYVEANLNSDLIARYEFSNEMWNFQFDQTKYAETEAEVLWPGEGTGFLNWHGMRSTQVMQLIDAVYAGSSKRYQKILGGQRANDGIAEDVLLAPLWQASDPGNYVAPHTVHDAWAITTYFGNGIADDASIITELETNGEAAAAAYMLSLVPAALETSKGNYEKHAAICRTYGIDLIAYEGGQHIDIDNGNDNLFIGNLKANGPKPGVVALFEAVNYSTQMALYQDQNRDNWKQAGGKLICEYVDIRAHTRSGSWGRMRNIEDILSPPYLAMGGWNTSSPRHWLEKKGLQPLVLAA